MLMALEVRKGSPFTQGSVWLILYKLSTCGQARHLQAAEHEAP